MSTVRDFEDIDIWQDGIELVQEIYSITRHGLFCKDFGLVDQIRRAAVSIPSNIAEGFKRESDVELKRFLFIAKGSAGEVLTQLLISARLSYITVDTYEKVKIRLLRISTKLGGFIRYLKR